MTVFRTVPAGDLSLVGGSPFMLSGAPYVRQKMACRFKFFLGEWFLDLREGLPYYRDVFVKNPQMDVIRSLFRRVALGTPHVVELPKFEVLYMRPERELKFDFIAKLDLSGGPLIVKPSDRLFIIKT